MEAVMEKVRKQQEEQEEEETRSGFRGSHKGLTVNDLKKAVAEGQG